jgi:hypothetical protein
VASTLQQAGWIKYRRGSIQITDVEGLRSGVCECDELQDSLALLGRRHWLASESFANVTIL